MISSDVLHLLRSLFSQIQTGTWFIVDSETDEVGTLRLAISLNANQYISLLTASGIMKTKGDNYIFSLNGAEIITTLLQRHNISLHFTKSNLPNSLREKYFVCVGGPIYPTPLRQMNANHRIYRKNGGPELDGQDTLLLRQLTIERGGNQPIVEDREVEVEEEDVPILEEEMQIEEQAEGLVIEARDEEQQQAQEYEPYQLTRYYRNQLEQFQEDYIRWEENQYWYHLRCQHFEETMLEQYERVLGLIQQDLPLREEEDEIEEFR